MKLYIDTTNSEKVILRFDEKTFESGSRKEKSQTLLPFLESTLHAEGKSLSDITEIEVNPGPGSFTGLRVSFAIAHTLGWLLKVPVNGKRVDKGELAEITY